MVLEKAMTLLTEEEFSSLTSLLGEYNRGGVDVVGFAVDVGRMIAHDQGKVREGGRRGIKRLGKIKKIKVQFQSLLTCLRLAANKYYTHTISE